MSKWPIASSELWQMIFYLLRLFLDLTPHLYTANIELAIATYLVKDC